VLATCTGVKPPPWTPRSFSLVFLVARAEKHSYAMVKNGTASWLTRSAALAPSRIDVHQFNPLTDARWAEFVACHPRASLYHTQPWLESLRRTYGFSPVAYTTSPAGRELRNGIVFCRIESWITGRRMVSLPFSDHCDPLMEGDGESAKLIGALLPVLQMEGWRYTELRPRRTLVQVPRGLQPNKLYCFHALDLAPGINELYSSLHNDCIRRKIKRADKEGLEYREGRSPELLAMFYRLFVKMRQKHGLPPQPREWFENLAEILGPAMQIRVALHLGRPVAGIITIVHRATMIYKYGGSDPELNKLGAMPWLFWRIIQEAKSAGLGELDLGRSDWNNPGLIAFKDRLGAMRTPVTYWRSRRPKSLADALSDGNGQRISGAIFSRTPGPVLSVLGRLLYRHIG
jgi:hypothetical protein